MAGLGSGLEGLPGFSPASVNSATTDPTFKNPLSSFPALPQVVSFIDSRKAIMPFIVKESYKSATISHNLHHICASLTGYSQEEARLSDLSSKGRPEKNFAGPVTFATSKLLSSRYEFIKILNLNFLKCSGSDMMNFSSKEFYSISR